MAIPIINKEPKNFLADCPVCKKETAFLINPNQDGTACCLGCAVVIVIPVMVSILKKKEEENARIQDKPDTVSGGGNGHKG